MTMSLKARVEHHSQKRDEKIKSIKLNQEREAKIEQDREMRRIKKEEEEAARRLQEIEQRRLEEIKKRESDYRQKREALMKFAKMKDQTEIEACREYLRVLEDKFSRSDEKQRMLLSEKIGRIQEHN